MEWLNTIVTTRRVALTVLCMYLYINFVRTHLLMHYGDVPAICSKNSDPPPKNW